MPSALIQDAAAKLEWGRYQRAKDRFRLRDERYHNLIKLLGGMFYSNDLVTTAEITPAQVREIQQTTGSQLVINRLAIVVRNYKNYLSQPPEIDVPVRRKRGNTSISKESERHADTNEKLLYATWGANRMELELQGIAHYTSGLGSCPIQMWPDIKERVIRYHILRPWTFYPMTRGRDFRRFRYVCVEDVMWGDEIKEEYGNSIQLFNPTLADSALGLADDEQYIVVQYFTDEMHSVIVGQFPQARENPSDKIQDEAPLTIAGPQTIYRVKNILGFIPFVNIPGNYIPHQDMGESDIEQSVGMNYYVNEMFNTQAEIAAFTSNPILVITGTTIPTEKIPNHPGAGISIPEPGAKAFFLMPPNVSGDYFQQIDRVMRYIEEATNQPEPVMGRVQPSVESGSAIQALMGGVAAQVATKQRVFKVFFEQLNAMTLQAYERVFPKTTISLHGTMGAYSGDHFYVELKGEEIDGWYANEIIYREGMFDFGSRIVNTLQMLSANLISRRTARRQVGVRSPLEEEEQIRAERLEDAIFAGNIDSANRGLGDIQRERKGLQRGKIPGQGGQGGLPPVDKMAGLLGALQNPGAGPGPGPLPPLTEAAPPTGSAPPDEATIKRALAKVKFLGKAYLVGIGTDGIRIAVTREVDKAKVERALEGLGTVLVEVVTERPEGSVRIRGAR